MDKQALNSRFRESFSCDAQLFARAPGRVNLLGEHVDYNDGWVLPAAIDRTVQLAAAPRSDGLVRLHALDLDAEVVFNLESLDARLDVDGQPLPSWAMYPAGVAWVLRGKQRLVKGMEGWFTSDIPIGSGLSSSAAVLTAFAAMWQALGGWEVDNLTLARLCQEAENRYVGVNCGLMDQFASANGVEGSVLFFDTRSLQWYPLPLPQQTVIIVADSGVRRSLANSAYNERRAACEQAVEGLRQHLPGIRALRDVTPDQFARFSSGLPELVARRARYVVEECARVQQALVLLQNGDAVGFGQLMFQTHAGLRDLYEVSCPELDALVDIASAQPGCFGARLTGAGFGGCTVNLVAEAAAEDFIRNLAQGYFERTGLKSEVYLCRASRGTVVIKN